MYVMEVLLELQRFKSTLMALNRLSLSIRECFTVMYPRSLPGNSAFSYGFFVQWAQQSTLEQKAISVRPAYHQVVLHLQVRACEFFINTSLLVTHVVRHDTTHCDGLRTVLVVALQNPTDICSCSSNGVMVVGLKYVTLSYELSLGLHFSYIPAFVPLFGWASETCVDQTLFTFFWLHSRLMGNAIFGEVSIEEWKLKIFWVVQAYLRIIYVHKREKRIEWFPTSGVVPSSFTIWTFLSNTSWPTCWGYVSHSIPLSHVMNQECLYHGVE